jgi:hypothetical protein
MPRQHPADGPFPKPASFSLTLATDARALTSEELVLSVDIWKRGFAAASVNLR